MTIQEVLKEVAEGRDLSYDVMRAIMMQMMSGDLTDAQIGALLMGLRMKGETVTEVTAAAQVMRDLVSPVETHSQPLVDLAGTGVTAPTCLTFRPQRALSLQPVVLVSLNMAIDRCPVRAGVPMF